MVLPAKSHDRLALEHQEELVLAAPGLVVGRQLPAGADLDEVEAEASAPSDLRAKRQVHSPEPSMRSKSSRCLIEWSGMLPSLRLGCSCEHILAWFPARRFIVDSEEMLREAIERYNDAWNDHDLDAIMAMHAPDMVFENHTAGESRAGRGGSRPHRLDLRDLARHRVRDPPPLRPRRPGRAGVDGERDPRERDDAAATSSPSRPASAVEWDGLDVIPFENGLVKRKDVYSDSRLDPAPGRPPLLNPPRL